jgi:5-methyltetrahydropteroyltriglutamate--homocysteine methyltransferase
LKKCFEGVGEDVIKAVHICCGYPDKLDNPNFEKADKNAYKTLLPKLDQQGFDLISIEDAHVHNDLSEILPLF